MKAYGVLELTEASPAQTFVEPLTLAQVRTFLKITETSPADDAQDELLNSFITAAREVAEIHQVRDLIRKQYDLHLDLLLGYNAVDGAAYPQRNNSIYNFGIGYEIKLREPLQSVDLFQYTDSDGAVTTLVEGTDYILDKNRSLVLPPFGQLWPFFSPHPSSAVLIRFTSGYSSTHPFWKNAGQRILQGMRLLIAGWHDGRLPWGGSEAKEYPYAVTSLLDFGARRKVH